ncbi:hydroxyethylthiazole kinase [Laribacter hongkongensis]|uniref:hydroxyethylthiazole kinase n=1 Tax=Laribacter hongkongensis TaxID=168471 RepID=UPI001EFCA0AC|nr:hydroxyethylthiazole kinase [Laribacter hongkongensis]MCG9095592.1 hydroxyethylthiazole kinase [Laribacter hongkongensis]
MSDLLPLPPAAIRLPDLVRQHPPLVHCLTNQVVSQFTANVLLAAGAAPAMVIAREEAGDFARMASAVLVNVGTLTSVQADAMRVAVAAALEAGTPWTLDPVAVGALAFRTQFCRELLSQRPTAIRGNPAEILALAGEASRGRGVDSLDDSTVALAAARRLADATGAVVAVTGATDFITDGERVIALAGGHPLLQQVTGTGCSLSALVAAMTAMTDDPLSGAAVACALMKLAGERAADKAAGPGSFAVHLLDEIAALTPADLAQRWPA